MVAKSPKVFSGSLIILSENSSFRFVFLDFASFLCRRLVVTAVGLIAQMLQPCSPAKGTTHGVRVSVTPFS